MEDTIYLAGGCFWGVERFFSQFDGITTEVGYANGKTENPTYEQVCRAGTDHAETVKVTYDPKKVSLPQIFEAYFEIIDPTSINRQGNDTGRQYRTGIYYTNARQKEVADIMIDWLQSHYAKQIAIEVVPLRHFYPAEEYHQAYLYKNPNGYCHIGARYFSAKLAPMSELLKEIPALQAYYPQDLSE
jgi:methionine-S-sulfoxide reductase